MDKIHKEFLDVVLSRKQVIIYVGGRKVGKTFQEKMRQKMDILLGICRNG